MVSLAVVVRFLCLCATVALSTLAVSFVLAVMTFCPSCHENLEHHPLWPGLDEPPVSNPLKVQPKQYSEYLFDYLPKYRSTIRILVLLGNGSAEAEIECELRTIDFTKGKPLKFAYEALSWSWGTAKPTGQIIIRKGDKNTRRLSRSVTPDLALALRALRFQRRDRYLWIDQICIDQDDPLEKNHQVEIMSEIYGRASRVCIWLGKSDPSSRMALDFIKNEVLQLQNFDQLCESKQASEKWKALLDLMQRPWFSRRWVVQEIALARRAIVYCGADKIPWKKFAVAVELFVEVETATHRLSEVMKQDPKFHHVPRFFEYVSALGASLLVEATSKLFRNYKPNDPAGFEDDLDSEADLEEEEKEENEDITEDTRSGKDTTGDTGSAKDFRSTSTRDSSDSDKHSLGQPLLTLEYLISSLSIFELTKPHDAVYALLAIARDTTPMADDKGGFRRLLVQTQQVLEGFTQKKRYKVNYQQPFADVCVEFVDFSIRNSKDRTRALDIICRPWAPIFTRKGNSNTKAWEPTRRAKRMRSNSIQPSEKMKRMKSSHDSGKGGKPSGNPYHYGTFMTELVGPRQKEKKAKQQAGEPEPSLPLPLWISSLSGAAHAIISQAGLVSSKIDRINADTLVGLPTSNQSLERNYNAAETREVELKSLRYVKRPGMNHWSLYVKGFVLDRVVDTQPASQDGAIPRKWAKAGGWDNVPDVDPPDEFWRTLVADRGRDGKNPPVYYSRACKDSFAKGGFKTGSVNTTALINNERCSIIAQFCRRVQAVIWNRCLITTESHRLGLAGQDVQREDIIAILYGCSVPVALRRVKKSKDDIMRQMEDDFVILRDRIIATYRKVVNDRKYRRWVRNVERALYCSWEEKMHDAWLEEVDGLEHWQNHLKQTMRIQSTGANDKYKIITLDGGPEFEVCPSEVEDVDKLLERRAYQEWKDTKRESAEDSDKGFRREAKRIFELQLRYYRLWKALAKKAKTRKQATANAGATEHAEEATGTSRTADSTRPSGTRNGPTGTSNGPDSANNRPDGTSDGASNRTNDPPSNNTRIGSSGTSASAEAQSDATHPTEQPDPLDDFRRRHKDWYLAPYKTDKSSVELAEPNWARNDEENLRIQEQWCYYDFLGECYVHGMMNGEAMAYQNERGISNQSFELR